MRLRIGPGPLIQTLTLKQIMTEFNSSRDHIGLLRRSIRLIFRVVLLTLGPIVVVGAGGYFYSTGGRFITTDNAYVKADKIFVAAAQMQDYMNDLMREEPATGCDYGIGG